jgi:hypothetical protein
MAAYHTTPPIPLLVRPSSTPLKSPLSLYEWSSQNSAIAANSFERGAPLKQISPRSGSINTPANSVGSGGKKKGPPEVQWDASKDRKYARLYSLSDADISDLPIIMRDETLKFELVHNTVFGTKSLRAIPRKRIDKKSLLTASALDRMSCDRLPRNPNRCLRE